MKVKLVQFENNHIEGLTLDKVYQCTGFSPYGNAYVIDDDGEKSLLYVGEFEVVEDD